LLVVLSTGGPISTSSIIMGAVGLIIFKQNGSCSELFHTCAVLLVEILTNTRSLETLFSLAEFATRFILSDSNPS